MYWHHNLEIKKPFSQFGKTLPTNLNANDLLDANDVSLALQNCASTFVLK
jgi:hypothetical protein